MGREIGQLLWAVLLFDLFIAFVGYLTRAYFGGWALAVTLGLAAFITASFLLILAVNLLGAGLVDLARAGRRLVTRGRARSRPGRNGA
jgi:hypothetical protein